jgi:hypothetical protein
MPGCVIVTAGTIQRLNLMPRSAAWGAYAAVVD